MIDWNPISKRLQYVLALKPTMMARLYTNVTGENFVDRRFYECSLLVSEQCQKSSTRRNRSTACQYDASDLQAFG
jgi:hypothetical protein